MMVGKNSKDYIGIFFIAGLHPFVHHRSILLMPSLRSIGCRYFSSSAHLPIFIQKSSGGISANMPPLQSGGLSTIPNYITTEVTLRATGNPIKKHRAGQFLFVRFPNTGTLNESHPFTISSAPQEDVLRVTVKASGDFTRALVTDLKAEQRCGRRRCLRHVRLQDRWE